MKRLLSIIKPCDAMKLNENVLTRDFTIGFELEAVCNDPDLCPKTGFMPGYHSDSRPSGNVEGLYNKLNHELGFGEGKIESDSSLNKGPDDRSDAWTFEYASPIIQFTQQNITKIYHFLKKLKDMNITTNKSCGFHTHISTSSLTKSDAAWALFCIANNEKLMDEIKYLEDIHFFSSQYASLEAFNQLKELGNKIKKSESGRYSIGTDYNNKYLAIRVHPQGTLEWRGPRNFLQNPEYIFQYIKKLFKVIEFIGSVVDKREYDGFKRSEVEEHFNVTGEFKSEAEQMKETRLRKLVEKIIAKPMLFAKLDNNSLRNIIYGYEGNDVCYKLFHDSNFRSWLKSSGSEELGPEKIVKIVKLLTNKNRNELSLDFYSTVAETYEAISSTIAEPICNIYYEIDQGLALMSKDVFGKSIVKNEEIITKYYKLASTTNSLQKKSVIDFFKLNEKYMPYSLYKLIAETKPSFLTHFNQVPVKAQRAMIKGTPYAIQYISNPDPSIVNSLIAKYGDEIKDYILAEV